MGLDFGSLSCRGILVRLGDGQVVAEQETVYPHGVMDSALPDGTALPPMYALQDPSDFDLALEQTVTALMRDTRLKPEQVAAIGVDTTSSTVIPVDAALRPLCLQPRWRGEAHAWPKMWKHHAAAPYAEKMTELTARRGMPVLARNGGVIGAEHFLSKVVQVAVEAPEVYAAAETFLELGDYITSTLTGRETRSGTMLTCKALWDPQTGYPPADFFAEMGVRNVAGEKLMGRGGAPRCAVWPGEKAGRVCPRMAQRLGLSERTVVSAAQMDAYAGLPGCGIAQEGELMMMLGTSTGYMLLKRDGQPISGVCAAVENSILPGYTNYAAGQACVGDALGWFVRRMASAECAQKAQAAGLDLHGYLSREAAKLAVGESGLISLDWLNGNKNTLGNARLSGMMLGLTLRTQPAEIYRCLIEATGFGARVIVENFESNGVPVRAIRACGGIAEKNPFFMQVYADILGREINVALCRQSSALGAAIYAARAAGLFPSLEEAIGALARHPLRTYRPDTQAHLQYDKLYAEYLRLYDYFGRGENAVMERLREMAGK